jgi:hypothetical protein
MEIGYFTMPSHPPECGLKEGHDWDLQVIRWLDELGYQEVWIGEQVADPYCRPTQLCHQRCETPIGNGRPAVKTGADSSVASTLDQIASFRAVKSRLEGERPLLAQSGRTYVNGISWSITNK